ncbi:MAG: alpha/beta family hydrolase [Ilumatobacteraceae bacterium]
MTAVQGVVLFPGSGSSATHSSLLAMEQAMAPLPVARVDFPYRKAGKSFPDKTPVLVQYVKDEVRAFAASLGVTTSSLVIGGRSMGGRMCSMAIADVDDPLEVAGLVLVSYPLHPPKKPDALRIEHLPRIHVPTLCVSGTKDDFGTPDELTNAFAVVPSAVTWTWMDNARHELARKDAEVAAVVRDWIATFAR